jgi:hypothetical protein
LSHKLIRTRQGANTKTRNEAANGDLDNAAIRAGLDSDTDGEDGRPDEDRATATILEVGCEGLSKRADKGTVV